MCILGFQQVMAEALGFPIYKTLEMSPWLLVSTWPMLACYEPSDGKWLITLSLSFLPPSPTPLSDKMGGGMEPTIERRQASINLWAKVQVLNNAMVMVWQIELCQQCPTSMWVAIESWMLDFWSDSLLTLLAKQWKMAQELGTPNLCGSLKTTHRSCLWSCQAVAIAAIWRVHQKVQDFSLFVCLSLCHSDFHINKSLDKTEVILYKI